MKLEITRVEGRRNDLLLRLERAVLDSALRAGCAGRISTPGASSRRRSTIARQARLRSRCAQGAGERRPARSKRLLQRQLMPAGCQLRPGPLHVERAASIPVRGQYDRGGLARGVRRDGQEGRSGCTNDRRPPGERVGGRRSCELTLLAVLRLPTFGPILLHTGRDTFTLSGRHLATAPDRGRCGGAALNRGGPTTRRPSVQENCEESARAPLRAPATAPPPPSARAETFPADRVSLPFILRLVPRTVFSPKVYNYG